MHTRKLQVVGNRSFSISLPKKWILQQKLEKQDTVFIEQVAADLIIHPGRVEANPKELTVNAAEIDDLGEFLVFCYVKNLDKLTILFSEYSGKRATEIRDALKYLKGFDVTEETERKIVVSFLFGNYSVTVPQLQSRMTHLIRLMLSGLKDKDPRLLAETEMVVDELYHLSKRILFACFHDPVLMKQNGLRHDEDVSFQKDIMKKLENIGDQLLILGDRKVTRGEIRYLEQLIHTADKLLRGQVSAHAAKATLARTDVKPRDPLVALSITRIRDLCIDILENHLSLQYNAKFF